MLLSLFYVIQGFDDIFTVLLFNVLGGVTHYLKTLQLHKKPHYQLTISPVWCLVATVQQCELSQKFNVFFCPNFQTICFVLHLLNIQTLLWNKLFQMCLSFVNIGKLFQK